MYNYKRLSQRKLTSAERKALSFKDSLINWFKDELPVGKGFSYYDMIHRNLIHFHFLLKTGGDKFVEYVVAVNLQQGFDSSLISKQRLPLNSMQVMYHIYDMPTFGSVRTGEIFSSLNQWKGFVRDLSKRMVTAK